MVLVAVSVNRAVVMVFTRYRLTEIYHHLLFYHEVRLTGSSIFVVETASSYIQNILKFLPDFISRKVKFLNRGTL